MSAKTELGVTLKYNRRFNLGSYQHEDIAIEVTGPYEQLVDGTALIAALVEVTNAMGTLTTSVYLKNRIVDKEVFKQPGV